MSGLTAMELERLARIEANRQRMRDIGLVDTVTQLAAAGQQVRQQRRQLTTAQTAARRAARAAPSGCSRRSERVAGLDGPNYNENGNLLALADKVGGGSRDRRHLRENRCEEVYGVEHLDALGARTQDWDLFVDGYDAAGVRVYDKVNGQTCHQCRQKTMGKRTCCASCQSLQGVLCGDCLYMRYGENVDEVNANPEWTCPLCRDICNCSFHRARRGWAPTGTLYRHASAEGYQSVAHFLVLNNLSQEAKPVALERGMCPPELTEELKKEIEGGAAAGATAAAGQAEVEAAAAAVEGQLLELEAAAELDEATAAAAGAPMRRSGRRDSAIAAPAVVAAEQAVVAPQAPVQKAKRQAVIQLASTAASAGKKQKGSSAAAAAAAKAVAVAPAMRTRRGLRVAAQ